MGFGDVRFSFLLGCFLGWLSWWHVAFGLFAGFLYGAVVGVALMALGKRGRRQHIPFGPFLAAGALTIILIGQPLIDAYRCDCRLTGRLRDSASLGSASLLVLRVGSATPSPPLRAARRAEFGSYDGPTRARRFHTFLPTICSTPA